MGIFKLSSDSADYSHSSASEDFPVYLAVVEDNGVSDGLETWSFNTL